MTTWTRIERAAAEIGMKNGLALGVSRPIMPLQLMRLLGEKNLLDGQLLGERAAVRLEELAKNSGSK